MPQLYENGDFVILIQEYFLSICAAAAMVALFSAITKHTKQQRIVAFSGGLFILLVILTPIVRLDQQSLQRRIASVLPEDIDTHIESNDKYRTDSDQIISDRCSEYILDKADQLGMHVKVEIRLDHSGVVTVPVGVRISGSYTEKQKEELSLILKNEMGVQYENQEWSIE